MKTACFPLLALTLCVAACSRNPPPEPAAETAAEGAASMPVSMAEGFGVKLAVAAPGALSETVMLYGNIQPATGRVRQIGARYPGVVRRVLHEIGDRVAEGETLATVESSESLQTYPVTASLAGVITARHANAGEVVGEKALFEVADYSRVQADLSAFPRDRARLAPGQTTRIAAADSPATAEGRVTYIAPAGAASNQLVVARVVLANGDARWTVGQFVTGEVVVARSNAGIVVVPAALQQIRNRPVVFVRKGERLEIRSVEVGRRAADAVEILGGLQAGEQYVAANSYLVKAELLKSEAGGE